MDLLKLIFLLAAASCSAQEQWFDALMGYQAPTTSSANNVALVSGNSIGTITNGAALKLPMPNSVTSGNTVIFYLAFFATASAETPSASHLTKSAGTATIGTPVMDVSTNAAASSAGCAIIRVPITGSGTLTLLYTGVNVNWLLAGMTEFSGLNASPVGPAVAIGGAGTSESTGAITTTVPGVICAIGTEVDATTSFTRTYSDTLVYKVDTATSTFTGISHFKLQSTSPNTLINSTPSSGTTKWIYNAIQYKSN